MFTSRHQAAIHSNQASANSWNKQYFADAVAAIDLAVANPELLGWLKILLGPKFDVEQQSNFYQILEQESEQHLNLVVLNILIQLKNEHHEKQVFKSIRKKIQQSAGVGLPTITEINDVEKFYNSVRQASLYGQENRLWFNIDEKTQQPGIIESAAHANLYANHFKFNDNSQTDITNIFCSHRELFNRYSQLVGKTEPLTFSTKKFAARLKKYFEFEQEKLLVEFYNSWKDRVSPEDYDQYNSAVAKRFAILVNKRIATILDELSVNSDIELAELVKRYEKKIIGIEKSLRADIKTRALAVEKYKSHVEYWMAVNKNLIPEKYRNMLPAYLAHQITETKIHLVPQEMIFESVTGDSLLHKASAYLSTKLDAKSIQNVTQIIFLLLGQGSNAFGENFNNDIALDLDTVHFSQQIQWRLVKEQLQNFPLIDPVSKVIANELINYADKNDSVFTTATHNATTKRKRLEEVLKVVQLLYKAHTSKHDQELINSLLSLQENLADESSALLTALKKIIAQIKSSDLSSLVTLEKQPGQGKLATKLKPADGIQLYQQHYERYRDNLNPADLTTKYNDLYFACIGLVDAAITGNVEAQTRLVSSPTAILSFNMLEMVQKEYCCRLRQLLAVHEDKSQIYHRLALMGISQLTSQFYVRYQDRYQDILHTLTYKHLTKSEAIESKSVEYYVRKALKILLLELIGQNPLVPIHTGNELDGNFRFSHRLLAKQDYQTLVSETLKSLDQDENSLGQYIHDYDAFVATNFKVISCQKSSAGFYQLNIDAVAIDAADRPVVSFIDATTGVEIARFEKINNQIEFRAYGNAIKLKINGNLESSAYIFRNENNALIDLNADFSAKNLTLGVHANQFTYCGNASITNSFTLEASNKLKFAANAKLSAASIYIKADELDLNGNVKVDNVTLQVAQSIVIQPQGRLTANADININANSLSDIRGKITANGNIKALIADSVYLHGNGYMIANNNFELAATSLMCTDQATMQSGERMMLAIEKTAIFDKQAKIRSGNFSIRAPIIKNYSPNLNFDTADFNILDTLTNHPTGVIKTKDLLRLRGENVWSSGNIEYGNMLIVTLNKVLVLGLAERKDLYEYFKNIKKKPARPCISGGNANIVTGLFLNLFSGVWTKNLSVTALADIDLLGLTCAKNTVKSRILAIDAGISVPNLVAVMEDLSVFFDLLSKQEYLSAFRGLLSFSALFRASSFTRLLLRTLFPQIGKPVDFIWGGGSLVCALPGLCMQVKNLYDLGGDVELNQFTTLLSSINSTTTQAMILESQSGIFREGIGAIEYHAPDSVTNLALDVAALAFPSISNTAFLSFNAGMQAEFSIQQRDFIACSRFNAWLAMNASQTFYAMYDADHEVMANNYSLTGNEAYLSGRFYGENFFANINEFFSAATLNVDKALLQVGHLKLLRDSKTKAHELQATTTDTEMEGQVKVDKAFLQADHLKLSHDSKTEAGELQATTTNTEIEGQVNVKQAIITATDTIDNKGTLEAIPDADGSANSDATAPVIVEKAHHVINEGEVSAHNRTVALISDDKIEQKGHMDADTVIEEAKDVDNSGVADVHRMLVSAKEHAELTGKIHLKATDKPGEIDFITPDLASSPDSEVTGDGLMYVDTTNATLGKVDVNQLAFKEDEIKDEQDFILGRGIWANVHARDALSLTSHNNLVLDQNINVGIDLSVSANAINILNNVHSSRNLNLVTTGGGIDVKRASVTADGVLAFNSNTYFNNDHGYEYGAELYIQAKGDILNQAGIWAAKSYMLVKSEAGSIIVRCDETDIQGKYDVMKHYTPGYVLGGSGEGHDGIGLVMEAGKKIVIDGSVVNSVGSNILCGDEGIDIIARHHTYESYYRHYHNWTGRSSTTIEYDNQLQASAIISQNGSNTLSSKSGYIYSCAGQFLSSHDNNFYAKGDITLLGLQLEKRCYKDSSALGGLFDHKTQQRDDENAPTYVINPENTRFISLEQNVNIYNAYVQNSGTLDIFGRNVTIADPVLNHYYSDETRGIGFNSPLLSLPNNISSLYNDYTALANSQSGIEFGANAWNMGADAMNSLNGVIGGLRSGSLAQSLVSSSYLTSVELSYSHSKTEANYQTLANNVGLNVGNLNIYAQDTLTFAGAPVSVANAAVIHARHFIETGIDLHSSVDTHSQSITAGFSLQGNPNFGGSLSESGSRSTYYFNQNFHVGGTLTMDVDQWDMSDANVVAGRLVGRVGDLSIVSHLNTTSTYARSISANTNGNFSVQNSSGNSGVIGTVSGILTTSGTDLNVNNLYLEGAKVVSLGINNINAKTVTNRTVNEYNHARSFGFSGNINNFTNPQPGVDWKQAIPMFNVAVGMQNYSASQLATINGNDLHAGNIIGDQLNTSDTDGLRVERDDHLNLQMRIPVFSQAGMMQLEDNLSWAGGQLAPNSATSPAGDAGRGSNPKGASIPMNDDDSDLPDLIDEPDYQESDTKQEHAPANPDHSKAGSKPASKSQDSADKENSYTKSYFSDASRQAKWRSTLFSDNTTSTDAQSANDEDYLSDVAAKDGLKDKVFESSDEDLAVPQEFKKSSPQAARSKPGAMDYVDAFNEGVESARDGLVDSTVNAAKTAWDGVNAIGEAAFGLTTQSAHERNMQRGKAINDGLQEIADDDASIPTMFVEGLGMLARDKYNEFVNDDGVTKTRIITEGVASIIFVAATGEAVGTADKADIPTSSMATEDALPGIPKLDLPSTSLPGLTDTLDTTPLPDPVIPFVPEEAAIPEANDFIDEANNAHLEFPQIIYDDFGIPSLADQLPYTPDILKQSDVNLFSENNFSGMASLVDSVISPSLDLSQLSKTEEAFKSLTDFGLNNSNIDDFYAGNRVRIFVNGIASETIEAYIQQNDNIVSLGIHFLENKTSGINIIDLLSEKALDLAKTLNADKVELYGIEIENPAVARYLRMRGFEKGEQFSTGLPFDDEPKETIRKMFDLRPAAELLPPIVPEQPANDIELTEQFGLNTSTENNLARLGFFADAKPISTPVMPGILNTEESYKLLSDFGLTDVEIEKFYKSNKPVEIEIPNIASHPINAYIHKENDILSIGILSIFNTTRGINPLEIWAAKSISLATALNADKIELYGVNVVNHVVDRYLRMKGFEKGADIRLPLFGNFIDGKTVRKVIDLKPVPELNPGNNPIRP
jgi:hypothetical protein